MDGQEHMCRVYAEARGYEIIGKFGDEGVSGGVVDRPGMRKMLNFLDERSAKQQETVVVIDDIKRWARDIEGHFALKTSISSRNATLESPTMKFEDTPEGKFVETVLAGAAELERNQNQKQVCRRMKARLQAGYWCFDNPPGYTYTKDSVHGKLLTPDEPKASVIKEALEGFASGKYHTREDVRQFLISKQFTHRGKKGAVYTEQVTRILTRVLYTGYVEYSKWGVDLHKGHHTPLISMETFNRIQERLQEKQRSPQRKDISDDFPLRGFVLCSECRQPMTAGWTQGRNQKYPYYRCKTKGCTKHNKNIPGKKIEDDFEELLKAVKPRENILKVIRVELLALWQGKITDVEAIRKRRNDRLKQVQDDIDTYCERIKETRSPTVIKTYESKIEELEMEQVRLGERIEKSHTRQYEFEPALDRVLEFIKDPFLMWKTGGLAQKRLVIRMIFDELLVYDHETGFYTTTFTLPVELSCIPELDKLELVEMPGIEPGCYVLK